MGIRGGINLIPGGIPTGEFEDFQQYEVFGILGFPGKWDMLWGVEGRYLWYTSAGLIRAAGDEGFITTFGSWLGFDKVGLESNFGDGNRGGIVSEHTFGEQKFGGRGQFLAHGALSYHFPQHISLGWRFLHFSDATFYQKKTAGLVFIYLNSDMDFKPSPLCYRPTLACVFPFNH